MKKHFKIYNEQAKRAYEFAKTFGAGEELLDRFSKIKIHFFAISLLFTTSCLWLVRRKILF